MPCGALVSAALVAAAVRPWTSRVSTAARWQDGIAELVAATAPADVSGAELAFLFIDGSHCASPGDFESIVEAANDALSLGAGSALVSLIGGGVIGGAREVESEHAISLLRGELPALDGAPCLTTVPVLPTTPLDGLVDGPLQQSASSMIALCDPWCNTPEMLAQLDRLGRIVCGGLTAPRGRLPSLAINEQVLEVGSGVVIGLGHGLDLHTIVAQGCAPVGTPFTITAGQGNIIIALDAMRPVEALARVGEAASDRERQLMQQALLCGILRSKGAADGAAQPDAGGGNDEPSGDGPLGARDWLARGILGATNEGAIVIGDSVEVGDKLTFMIRDRQTAQADLDTQLQRYRLERQIVGDARAPLGALLFSCTGRGANLFGVPNHDSECIGASLPGGVPIGGFFCNGEIGPVGIVAGDANAGRPATPGATSLHGFTSVIAVLLAASEASGGQTPETGGAPGSSATD